MQSLIPFSRSQIKRFEVTCLYSPLDAKVDIVLVHGLNGHPEKTWAAKNGVFWPTDLLPASLKGAKARILVYGYNADVYAFGGDRSASSDMIHQHAQTLVSGLALERQSEDCGENAIIWVGHSLGGILIKRALELSNDLTSKSSNPSRSIFVSTYGIIFLGTPHTGAEPAKWALLLQGLADALIPKKILDTEPHLVQTLKSNNEVLQNINEHFLDIYQRFQIDMVHEAVKTDLKGLRAFIVDQASASPQLPGVRYYGIEASHTTMCKFESKSSPGYLNVSTQIRAWVLESPQVIQTRWIAERKARQQLRENDARELLGIYADSVARPSQGSSANTPNTSALSNSAIISTSMIHSVASIEPAKTSDAYFIKPPGFRPNSQFVGRETELAELHKMLFDKKRRAEGTAAVLLQCLPGGGKSCLARQYVYTHFDDFPGGIFWVRAKSQEQLAAGFWDIARKVALKPSANDPDGTIPKDPQQFISVVTDWFSVNHDWLLVLDGIQFDHSESLRRFIPDSKNTSLIYTSTERSVGGDSHFMNPQVIRIPLLSAREAQQLFLWELDKTTPTTDDLKNSMELVQRMGFLPLVIHAVAQRLKATGEPLAKFTRSYATGPKLRDLDTYKFIVEQLTVAGAFEVLNLMNVLCFFNQYIPFEMISLGVKALDVPTKAYERATGRSLNNTIKVLNRFALIDRNAQEPMRSSQSSKGSGESLTDDVDVIKLHSVVQDFFIDSLRADGELPQWLQRAVVLFRASYEKANARICSKTNAGLVSDYRSYEIHGQRLLGHLLRNEKKSPSLRRVRETLEPCLQTLKDEIERRTRESSYEIVHGRPDAYQTSIFDRTSSSSDTGPESPGAQEMVHTYTWESEDHRGPYESPVSLTHGGLISHDREDMGLDFLPPPRIEDPGYDSDRDEAESMTARPSQRTPRLEDKTAFEDWEMVRGHRERDKAAPLDLHRTVKIMERTRYHDSAGAWRAVNPAATDPRVNHETAQAFIPTPTIKIPSRGRTSGHSQAEVALRQISRNSPPPIRGGGSIVIQDRKRSPQPRRAFTDYLTAGNAIYAPAEVGDSRSVATTSLSVTRNRSTSGSSLRARPATPAMNSLQRFPHSLGESISPISHQFRERQSPSLGYGQPYPSSEPELYQNGNQKGAEDISPKAGAPFYPRQMGSPSIDYIDDPSVRKRGLPHDGTNWHSRQHGSLPYPDTNQYMVTPDSEAMYRSYDRNNNLAVFERDSDAYLESGYTSQPMSRDASGESARGARRPSLAESEPAPQMPDFSPRLPQTSYQIYENMRERSNNGLLKKSPKLDFARARNFERINEWSSPSNLYRRENVPPLPPRPNFNPNAPIFLPRTQSQPPAGPSRKTPPSPLSAFRQSPPYPEYRQQQEQQQEQQAANSRPMTPSSSGGVRIGRRMIGFGDFPESVDLDLARQRVERQRSELSERRFYRDASPRVVGAEDEGSGGDSGGGAAAAAGGAGYTEQRDQQRLRFVRIDPGTEGGSGDGNGNGNVPAQTRAVSDCEIFERDRPCEEEGRSSRRRRGLSSPERAVGLEFVRAG